MRNFLFNLIGVTVIALSTAGAWLWMDYQVFNENLLAIPGDGWRYEVTAGANLRSIGRDLQAQGVLAHPAYLRWMARTEGYANRIRAGEYEFSAHTTPRGFLEKIVSGKVVQYSLTIVEGWNFQQLRDAVAA
ncbi:MAG: endolytic transglycosylase MltG, partial [Gammaproteobacteria bacterium]|nr:endolytic transglycosylase MltG [Gammaproteobacteria bacterium]